jgi:hypothetical protein
MKRKYIVTWVLVTLVYVFGGLSGWACAYLGLHKSNEFIIMLSVYFITLGTCYVFNGLGFINWIKQKNNEN